MNARHFVISLALSLLGTGLWAQQNDLPQVFSPNAAELGKYGKIPVSYFNGLPNISIPLTELKAKNYTLPIYLTYHASGNKPDQHPGWVGLGWTLHAGGCINRIINGKKDEMNWEEYRTTYLNNVGSNVIVIPFEPGYFARMESVQGTDWSVGDNLKSIYDLSYHKGEDYYPDEFQICIEDIQASFYFVGNNQIRIVSDSDADFEVECHVNTDEDQIMVYPNGSLEMYSRDDEVYYAHLYHYIDELIVTNHDGTKYYFGGNHSSIEFSVEQRSNNNWNPIATANTWMLKKIERPDGETIEFTYSRSNIPVIKSDVHRVEIWHEDIDGGSPLDHTIVNSIERPALKENISFSFLLPTYLSSIKSIRTGHLLTFLSSISNEKQYTYNYSEFVSRAFNCSEHDGSDPRELSFDYIQSKDKYKCLNRIVSNSGQEVVFGYENSASERLRLGYVRFLLGNSADRCYSMQYDTHQLPEYNSKQTDAWGYYNGRIAVQTITDTASVNDNKQIVDTLLMKSEILTKLTYPTGGYTEFEYEAHRYGKVATQFPFSVITANGIAGGLRIKRIISQDGSHRNVRHFNYSQNGISTGILAGYPIFKTSGTVSQERYKSCIWRPFFPQSEKDRYDIFRETYLRQLSTTNGNHVTYSLVTEYRSDGSKLEFSYSNHDSGNNLDELPLARYETLDNTCLEDSFTSHQLSRGLITEIREYDMNGHLTRAEKRDYSLDTTNFIKAVDWRYHSLSPLMRLSYLKIYSFFPALIKKTLITYPDDTGSPNTVITEYTYDSHRRLVEEKRKVKGVMQRDKYKYIDDCYGEPYYSMKSRNMVAYPVEHLHYRKDTTKAEKVVGAELTTWKASENNRFVPKAKFVAALGEGVSSFTPFNGSTKDSHYGEADILYEQYDTVGNILLAKDRSGFPTTFFWDSRGVNPTFIAKDAMNGAQTRSVPGTVTRTEVDSCSLARTFVKSFTSTETGPFSLTFKPTEAVSEVVVTMDGDTLAVSEMLELGETIPSYTYWTHGSANYLPAGNHEIRIRCNPALVPKPDFSQPSSLRGLPVLVFPFSGSLTISYSVRGLVERTLTSNDLFFEDFESAASGPVGFHSGKARTGSYTVSIQNLNPYRSHVLDYRRKTGSGAWEYVRTSFTGSATIGGSGVTVDQIRVFPEDADVESYTWDSAGNLLSRTDARGITESYEYDALGRLIAIRNNDENHVEQYKYNYQNK